jgi:hypothetical protein
MNKFHEKNKRKATYRISYLTQTEKSDESRGGKGERTVGICPSPIIRKLVPAEKDCADLFKTKLRSGACETSGQLLLFYLI